MPIWGKLADKYGNKELLKIGMIGVALTTLLWIFSKHPVYIIFVPQLISGIGWAAFNLASSNFIYDTVSPHKRGLCVAYFNTLAGSLAFLGGIAGSFLIQYIPNYLIGKFFILFLISFIAMALCLVFIKKIKEVRKVAHHQHSITRYLHEIRPIDSIKIELLTDMHYLVDTIKKAGKLGRFRF